ncbi:glyoxylase I 4-like [Aristolochia californica]|uniref:glyoxylase I 4-like n=1 Tax=Aristolochia californica TaxID=171875 RepID=UPI0035D840DA
MGIQEEELTSSSLPLLSLNHVSFLCRSVQDSVKFYQDVLGFSLIKRPSSFDFEGAWLFSYGIGIHLLESNSMADLQANPRMINPKDNHISFQCSDMELVKRKLQGMGLEYVTAVVEEGGIQVDQLFFHDPDGYMIEICNCDDLPVLPLSASPLRQTITSKKLQALAGSKAHFAAEMEEQMLEKLVMDIIDITL